MKTETGTFTPASTNVVVLLEDDTINVKGIFFQVSVNSGNTSEASTGFTDGTRSRSKSLLTSSGAGNQSRRSSIYAITHYKSVSGTPTLKIAGKPATGAFDTPGQFALTFDEYDNIPIDFTVVGD